MELRGGRLRTNLLALALWLVTAAIVSLLALRFGMRAVGVRDDVPFPGFIYALTAPLVEPFYRFFPVSERFDYYAIEVASLVAASCVGAATLGVYVLALLLFRRGRIEDLEKRAG